MSPGLIHLDGFIAAPLIVIRPFLQASVEMVRVLNMRIAHSHLSIRSSVFGIVITNVSFVIELCHGK
jgi:hypothetical protein